MTADEELLKMLKELFAPMVEQELAPLLGELNARRQAYHKYETYDLLEFEYSVSYKHPLLPGDHMFYLSLDLRSGELFMDELARLGETLVERFGTEDEPGVKVGDIFFTLGDGDDASCVTYSRGKINIWLRGWKKDPFAPDNVGDGDELVSS